MLSMPLRCWTILADIVMECRGKYNLKRRVKTIFLAQNPLLTFK